MTGRGDKVDRRRKEAAAARPSRQRVTHRWRFWENARGEKVVAAEIDALPDEDALSIHAQMIIVRQDGLSAARHLVEDIYEVEAHGIDRSYRLLFSSEGQEGSRPPRCPAHREADTEDAEAPHGPRQEAPRRLAIEAGPWLTVSAITDTVQTAGNVE